MMTPRRSHTATLLEDGRVLVIGGDDPNGVAFSTCELYNPPTGTWINREPWPYLGVITPRPYCLTARSWWLAVIPQQGTYRATAEIYDPATGIWSPTNNLSGPRSRHTASLLPNGIVLVAGGRSSSNSSSILASAELYDPATGNWSNTGSFGGARYVHSASVLPERAACLSPGNSGGMFPYRLFQWADLRPTQRHLEREWKHGQRPLRSHRHAIGQWLCPDGWRRKRQHGRAFQSGRE